MTETIAEMQPAWNFPSVGRWGVSVLPTGWIFVAGFGIRKVTFDPASIAANVALGEDELKHEGGLREYVEAQAKLIEGHLKDAKTAGPQPTPFEHSEEANLFMVRHTPDGVPGMLHVQSYVRMGLWVGIVTLTTIEAELRAVRADYEAFLKGLRILAPKAQSGRQVVE